MIYATEITVFKDSINQGWLELFQRFLTKDEENYALYNYECWLMVGLRSDDLVVDLDSILKDKCPLPFINYIMREVYIKFNLKN